MKIPAWPETYAHVKDTWLAGSNPLPDMCPLYSRIKRMLLGVTSSVVTPRIGAAQDVEERMLRWSEVERGIMRDVIETMVESTESDGLTESVTEESAEESPIMRDQPIRRTKNGLRKYKSMVRKVKERVNDKVTNTMS